MSLLEDRLVRILELRKLGRNEEEIASALELSPEIIKDYENSVHEEIRKYPYNTPALLGLNLGISPLVVGLYRGHLSKLVGEAYKEATTGKAEEKIGHKEASEKLRKARIKRRQAITKKYPDRVSALCEAILGEFSTRKEFEDHTGLNHWQIYYLAKNLGLELPDFKKLKIKDNVRKIQEALDYGFSMATEISLVTGIDNQIIRRYNRTGLIELPEKRKSTKRKRFTYAYGKIAEHKDLVDRMIAEGSSQTGIARKIQEISREPISKEGIRQYIVESKQYKKWKKAYKEPTIAKAKNKQNLVNTLYSIALKKAEQEGYREAVKYYLARGGKATPIKKLVRLVKAYKEAQKNGERLSYKKLAEASNLKYTNYAETYLKHMGLGSLFWTARYLTPLEENAIKRIHNLGLNAYDIAYFLDKKPSTIFANLRRLGKIPKKRQPSRGMSELKHVKGYYILSYREASQIYGFTDEMNAVPEEIAQALGKPIEIVEAAINCRKKIEPKLTRAIQSLFPYETITRPYR